MERGQLTSTEKRAEASAEPAKPTLSLLGLPSRKAREQVPFFLHFTLHTRSPSDHAQRASILKANWLNEFSQQIISKVLRCCKENPPSFFPLLTSCSFISTLHSEGEPVFAPLSYSFYLSTRFFCIMSSTSCLYSRHTGV